MSELTHSLSGQTLWITFNRPEARNALTFAMYEALADLCRNVPEDGSVRAVVLSGAGGKAFAAGTDMTQFRAFDKPQDALDYEARIDAVLEAVERCPVPTVAAINGACTGGGAAIAAACDLRIASASLKFGFPIARTLGNCLAAANLGRLSALIGSGPCARDDLHRPPDRSQRGAELWLGNRDPARRGRPDGSARSSLAMHLAKMAPLTLRATKEAMRRNQAAARAEDSDLIELCYMSNDFRHGLEAFLAKEKPQWTGT